MTGKFPAIGFLCVLAASGALSLQTSASAANSTIPYKPSLGVSTAPPFSRIETRFAVQTEHGAPATAEVDLYIPAGWKPNVSEPVGSQLGTISGATIARYTPTYSGTVRVADPGTNGAGCDTSGHTAVWTADLTSQAGSFSFPIFVRALVGQPTELHWCLGKSAPRLDAFEFDLTGVFTRPISGEYLWDGRFTPYDPTTGEEVRERVAALALVRLPQLVSLHATYSRKTGGYAVSGRVTENGVAVRARVVVSRSVNGGPFVSTRHSLAFSDSAGLFKLQGRLSARHPVRFQAHASPLTRTLAKPLCGKDVNGVPCVHETLAAWEKDSPVVTIRP